LPTVPYLSARSSLREQITDVLRGAVITGEMRPGAVYSAPALAARFGVSATPVREAMLDLAKEGLVEPLRNKGFRVTELCDTDLDELTELRMLIEVPTVASLAVRYTPAWDADIGDLRRVADEIVAHAQDGDLIAYVGADRRFHLGLLALSGNGRLVAIVGELRSRSRLYGLEELARRGRLTASALEHSDLLDLLVAGDADGARSLMRRHIGHVRGTWAGRPEAEPGQS
jgi:DNA-binding GntR family transcriptional regulator